MAFSARSPATRRLLALASSPVAAPHLNPHRRIIPHLARALHTPPPTATSSITRTTLPRSTRFFSTTNSKMGVVEIKSKDSFKTDVVEKSGKLVFVDFYADWCGPCRAIAPRINDWSEEYTDIDFYKVNVDEQPDVAQEFGIRAMPTFLLFKDGEKIAEVVGANPSAIKSAIEKYK